MGAVHPHIRLHPASISCSEKQCHVRVRHSARTFPTTIPSPVSCPRPTLVATRRFSFKASNGSQFFIATVDALWLDGNHVVFGEVASKDSFMVVKEIKRLGSDSGDVRALIMIIEAGEG